MKIIKVVYNNDCSFISDIVDSISERTIIEKYNISYHKDKKKGYSLMQEFGALSLPLIVLENENLENYDAIWNESNPDWKKEIERKLNE